MNEEIKGSMGRTTGKAGEKPVDSLVMFGVAIVVDVVSSTVRRNLMNEKGYSPYCGAERCYLTWPRTLFDGEQFKCRCGWRSAFEPEFIAAYKDRWNK